MLDLGAFDFGVISRSQHIGHNAQLIFAQIRNVPMVIAANNLGPDV